jgi:NADH-quinone oxidoreductase subunit A
MFNNYLPILIFLGVNIALAIVLITIGQFLGPKNPSKEKLSPFECGFKPFEDSRLPFDVKFYLVAILFIIFDLETAFLFPWAVSMHKLGWFGLVSVGIFGGLLIVGFIYEWKKGALEWE